MRLNATTADAESGQVVRKHRILHVVNTARAEGTPRLVLDWLQLNSEAVQGVAFLFSEPADLQSEFEKMGIWLRWRSDPGVAGLRRVLGVSAFTRVAVRDFKPDLVICWPMGMSAWVLMGCRLEAKCGFVTHAGNPPGVGFKAKYLHSYFTFVAMLLLDGRIAACSHYIKEAFLSIGWPSSEFMRVIYNAIDTKRFTMSGTNNEVRTGITKIVMVGTLEVHKDQPTLIHAVRVLKDRNVLVNCRLVGDGSRRSELEDLIVSLDVRNECELLGSRNDVPALLAESDLFVLATTIHEGRPGVILEALSAGLPVVASDVKPCREVLGDGRWGLLAPANDASALADAICFRLARPLTLSQRTAQAEYVSSFTVSSMIAGYLSLGKRSASMQSAT